MDMLDKSIFTHFLHREPTAESMTTEGYRRDEELSNMVDLCTMFVESGLQSWDAKAPKDDQNRLRLQRIFSSKSMMAWSELLWEAVCARLDLTDTDERLRVFYRQLSPGEIERVRKVVLRLSDWSRLRLKMIKSTASCPIRRLPLRIGLRRTALRLVI